MTDVEGPVIQYHRRNDRTPEKDFDKREEANKKLSCEVRKAVERARNRITDLQDEVEERDFQIETEKLLRIEAENKLQEHLVDPYKSPEVNRELRHRLPHAKKDDPKLTGDYSDEDLVTDNSREIIDIMENQSISQTERPPSPDQVGPNRSPSQVRRILDFKVGEKAKGDAKRPYKTSLPPHMVGVPQFMPHMLYRPGSFTPSGAYSYNLTSPRQPVIAQHKDHPDDQSDKMDTSLSVSELHTEELPHDESQSFTKPQQPYVNHPSQPFTSFQSPLRSAPFVTHSSPMYHPTSVTESVLPTYTNHLSPADQTRQVALLLSELDAAKAQNKKLMDKLINLELDLETEKIKAKVKEADEKSHTDASVAAGLVQEVHKAQRRKEDAMMGRIKVANQERDEAMFRLSELDRRYEESFGCHDNRSDQDDDQEEYDLHENFDHLMTRIGQFDFPSVQEYTALVERLEEMKQRQREIATDEMSAVMEQRDLAMAKARKYEEEIIKRQREDSFNSNQNVAAELDIVKKERELALTQIRQLQDENETVRIYRSLHKSLCPESIHQNTLNNSKLKENNNLVAELQDVTIQRDQLLADLDKRDRKLEETQSQVKKLERLVTLLRKKLRGTDISSED